MADDNKSIFGGITKFDGYFDAADQGKAVVRISRGGSGATALDDATSFYVSSYSVGWQRSVGIIRPLNSTGMVAQVGRGTGTVQLSGLIGSLDAFKKVLGEGNKDICDPLLIEFDITTMQYKCSGNSANKISGSSKVRLVNCIPQGFQITGQTEQQGMIIQQASLTCLVGGLQFA